LLRWREREREISGLRNRERVWETVANFFGLGVERAWGFWAKEATYLFTQGRNSYSYGISIPINNVQPNKRIVIM
jgi:hypothetical protein